MSDVETIREMVEEVRKEHCSTFGYDSAGEPVYDYCASCDDEPWPCPTLRLAEKVLVLAEALVAAQQFMTPEVTRGPASDGWSNSMSLIQRALSEAAK